jgi:hypothetical protein
MTDLLSIYFVIGISVFLTIMLFCFKNKYLSLISGLGWSIIGVYDFTRAYSGDPDAGTMTWAFGWICLVLALVCWTSPLWLTGMKVIKETKKEVIEDDYWTAKEKRMEKLRARRPKRRANNPWNDE